MTTNPSLIAKEGRDFTEVVNEITTIVDGPISAEVLSMDHKQMIEEAEKACCYPREYSYKDSYVCRRS